MLKAIHVTKKFGELVAVNDLSFEVEQGEIFGIAGLVIAYANLDELEQAAFENSRLTPDMRALLREKSPLMADLLDTTLDQLF